ncbi:hypothetical protein ACFTSF_23395 [Kribbella sp. NPDC056951]|uniref:hypothetical protein n=1 Tax=Kribbella sp. NPDC056951 TaxID=3345978 RepID=UPI003628E1A8
MPQIAGAGAPRGVEHRLNVNHAQTFSTLAELRAASTAIVEGTAGEQATGEISGIPTTITRLAVTKVVWGDVTVPNIEIRQLGVAGQSGNASAILTPGTKYLVFVTPSTGADDATDDRYLVAGDAGPYELLGDQYVLRGGNRPPDGQTPFP